MSGIVRSNQNIEQRIGNDSVYGNGADGNVIISTNISLTKDMYYNDLTINANCHLNTNGFRVFVKGTLTMDSGSKIGIGAGDESSSNVLKGRAEKGQSQTNSIGGSAAGSTYTASKIPQELLYDLEKAITGSYVSSSGEIVSASGGAGGGDGTAGTLTPAGAGAAGALNRNVGVPGGPGSSGTGVPSASLGGLGAKGGPVVIVVAKNIVGTGQILSQGNHATAGQASQTGTAGTKTPNATLTHLVDGTASYITATGSAPSPHASVTAPNLPHGGHVPHTANHIHGHTFRHVAMGNIHHTNNNVYGVWHADHGSGVHGPFGHHYGDYNNTPHVNTLTGTYFNINSINHNTPHRNHTGVAFSHYGTHYSGSFNPTHDVPHFTEHSPADKFGPASHSHRAYPRHHVDNNHGHFLTRQPGTISSQGSNTYPGGNGGTAGSSTAGQDGQSGGGGGIIVVTEQQLPNTISVSTSGGSVNSQQAESGMYLLILNQ
jgi:hypothetical protein